MTALSDFREDVADAVGDLLGIPCTARWNGNVEPNTAHVRWGADSGPWLTFDTEQATFCGPEVSTTVVLMANSTDYGSALDWLECHVVTLAAGLGRNGATAMPRSGRRCPPVLDVSEPGRLDEDHQILAVSVQLVPVSVSL